jgi:hypothetical protein
MEKDVARHVVRVAFRCSAELQELLRTLKDRCSADEYKTLAFDVAKAVDAIGTALIDRALSSHPDLADEIEANLKRSDHAM